MRCAGSSFFISSAKYRPAGPPPMQTMRMGRDLLRQIVAAKCFTSKRSAIGGQSAHACRPALLRRSPGRRRARRRHRLPARPLRRRLPDRARRPRRLHRHRHHLRRAAPAGGAGCAGPGARRRRLGDPDPRAPGPRRRRRRADAGIAAGPHAGAPARPAPHGRPQGAVAGRAGRLRARGDGTRLRHAGAGGRRARRRHARRHDGAAGRPHPGLRRHARPRPPPPLHLGRHHARLVQRRHLRPELPRVRHRAGALDPAHDHAGAVRAAGAGRRLCAACSPPTRRASTSRTTAASPTCRGSAPRCCR